ncbi:MAG: ATP citrate lyase citrate-binding domain-containing protein [Candidatus Roizmanbacteria bacterium]|nr:ATP citrate lyase citrate-binding domain-containing protein [Candidatus Roizmanbacteria bacterium]
MSRVKLTEYRSKQLLYQQFGSPYDGISAEVDSEGNMSSSTPLSDLSDKKMYVVKVDQGVKGRMKKGLVQLRITKNTLGNSIKKLARKGYTSFIIEEMLAYEQSQERYISIERVRDGLLVRYARVGGIDIEEKQNEVKSVIYHSDPEHSGEESRKDMDPSVSTTPSVISPQDDKAIQSISKTLSVPSSFIQTLLDYFDRNYASFLEINPLVVKRPPSFGHPHVERALHHREGGSIIDLPFEGSTLNRAEGSGLGGGMFVLDLAVEVDSTAQFFVKDGWTEKDVVQDQQKSPEEISIKKLSDTSHAALSFTQLNKDGSVWVLLSGGGASITLADEFYNLGHGKDLGNYGEYSGNPNAEETYLYTKEVLKALFKSKSKKKILLIGGGVANFTDVRITFQGIIKALEENKKELGQNDVIIYVRRGGPMQKEGLAMMETWLQTNSMYGYVAGPELPLYEIVRKVVKVL